MSLAAGRGVAFEMCPTSNHQTGACDLRSHPLKPLLRAGVPVTINTDDPAISGTSLKREFALARRLWKLTDADERLLTQNAIQAAFVEDAEDLARFVWR
jgi:adenosine deaminase